MKNFQEKHAIYILSSFADESCFPCWDSSILTLHLFSFEFVHSSNPKWKALDMLNFVKSRSTFTSTQFFKKIQIFGPTLLVSLSGPFASFCSSALPSSNVGIFWDLDNKPPKSFPPYDAAIKLKKAAQRFGFVKHMIAYANPHAFSYVPPSVRAERRERKALNELETIGIVKSDEPYICRVCGRRFYTNVKFINHFKQIHEREQMKRLNQIESARGKKRVRLVGKFSVKMDKYNNAAREVLTPKVGYGLGDELKRAGFWVREVSDKPQAADAALRRHIVDMMDKRAVECVVLVSDDSDFVELLNEARLRCLKTVVVGDDSESALKRMADAAFSWKEIMLGKAKEEAVSVVGRWKDRNVLQRLEWTYDPGTEKNIYYSEIESEESDVELCSSGEDDTRLAKGNGSAWWEMDSRTTDMNKTPLSSK